MKTIAKFITATFLLTILYLFNPQDVKSQYSPVNFQVFYDNLSPYGQWIDYPGYGYAWVPGQGQDFVPYSSGGHWVWTEYGWTWASDYSWGWAPFHYGRWEYDSYFGWVWLPDNQWGPAWVSWRRSAGFYGWSPLSPGISINIAIGGYNPPADRWCFVEDRYMGRHDIHNYYGPRSYNQQYIRNSTIINDTYIDNRTHNTYITGPRREEVQRVSGQQIRPILITESDRPGQKFRNNELNLYRPTIAGTNGDGRPEKVVNRDDRSFDRTQQRRFPDKQGIQNSGVNPNPPANTDNNNKRMPPRKFEEQQLQDLQQQKDQQLREQQLKLQQLQQQKDQQVREQQMRDQNQQDQMKRDQLQRKQQDQQRNQELQQQRQQQEQQRNMELQQQRKQQDQQRNQDLQKEKQQQVERSTQQSPQPQRQFSPHSKDQNNRDQQ